MAILVGMREYLIVSWFVFFLISSDDKHLFLCFMTICLSPLENCLSLRPIFLEVIINFGDESLVSCFICKYFLPFHGLSFFLGLFRCKQGFPVQNLLSLCMYVCMYSFVCLFIIFNSLILDYNVFFSHYSCFSGFCQFFTLWQGGPVSLTYISFFSHYSPS